MGLSTWRKDETFSNYFALVAVVLCALSSFFQIDFLSPLSRSQVQFIRNVFLLDFSHVFFTYLSLNEVPEMRQWIDRKTNGRPLLFWFGLLAMLIGFFAFAFAFHSVDRGHTTLRSVFFFTISTMPLIHAIRQTKGLAQLQTRAYGNAAAEKREGLMFQIFLALALIRELPMLRNEWFDNLFLAGELMVITGLFVQAFVLERGQPKQKMFYLVRMFAYTYHSGLIAYATIGAIHGTDYLRVTQLQVANSSMDSASRQLFSRLMIVGIAIAGVISLPRLVATPREARFATALAFTLVYSHYVLDFFIYRMKDPASRQFIAPLLRLPNSAEMPKTEIPLKASA